MSEMYELITTVCTKCHRVIEKTVSGYIIVQLQTKEYHKAICSGEEFKQIPFIPYRPPLVVLDDLWDNLNDG